MSTRTQPESEHNQRHRNESMLFTQSNGLSWLGWVVGALLVVSFSIVGGLVGGLAGVVTVTVWFSLGTPYALATGVVLLMALTPDGIGSTSVMIVGAGFIALVLVPTFSATEQQAYAITTLSTTVTLSGLTWLLVQSQPIWIVAAVLIGTLALFIYGLYRYQRLQLGLLDGEESSDRDRPSESTTTGSDQQ